MLHRDVFTSKTGRNKTKSFNQEVILLGYTCLHLVRLLAVPSEQQNTQSRQDPSLVLAVWCVIKKLYIPPILNQYLTDGSPMHCTHASDAIAPTVGRYLDRWFTDDRSMRRPYNDRYSTATQSTRPIWTRLGHTLCF